MQDSTMATMPSTRVRPTRKRSRSSVEIFNLSSTSYDTKRARLGIQNLTTDASTTLSTPVNSSYPAELPVPHSISRLNSSESLSGKEATFSVSEDNSDYDNIVRATSKIPTSHHDHERNLSTSDSTSSSDESSNEGVDLLGDEDYDSDSESGSTTTSSSSSSSSPSGSSDGDSEDGGEENEEGNSSSRSATIGFPSPEQIKTSSGSGFDFASGFPRPPLIRAAGAAGPGAGVGVGAASMASAQSLTRRLHSLLPQLAAANEQLEDERASGVLGERNIEALEEDQDRYIEMDLGLGVLEERRDGASVGSDNDGDESEAGETLGKSWTAKGRTKKHDVMAALMGRKGVKKSAIQVVDE